MRKWSRWALAGIHSPRELLSFLELNDFCSHVDFGAFTLIYQDTPGLEILTQGPAWRSVAVVPNTFVVNTGYIMEKLTNRKVIKQF